MNTKIKNLTIPDSVLHLADCAFRGNTAFDSVSAPAEMLRSFLDLSKDSRSYIKTVNVTSGNKIYSDTFKGYSSLKSVTIAESVNTIGDRAFKDLDSLTELNYLGTTAQWKQVIKGVDWDSGSNFVVKCSDGQVQ